MLTPLHTPRINNNDDSVRLHRLLVDMGASVRAGDPVAELVTDKALVTVEATRDGHVVEICATEGAIVEVDSTLLWLGDDAHERPPAVGVNGARSAAATSGRPTLKAQLLLDRYGLDATIVPASGPILTAADVERYVAAQGPQRATGAPSASPPLPSAQDPPAVAGTRVPLSPRERGMLRAVSWHRDAAVPGYIELPYDPRPWERHAQDFQEAQGLLFSPLQALMAWKLARLAATRPALNSTIIDDQKYVYADVNVGVTVQSASTLYLVVVHQADRLDARAMCDQVTSLQRCAMSDAVEAAALAGATLAFSSMARWPVSRHMPILPPYTSLIVAHSGSSRSEALLGATYDHRVLTGADVAAVLAELGSPPAEPERGRG